MWCLCVGVYVNDVCVYMHVHVCIYACMCMWRIGDITGRQCPQALSTFIM